MPHKAIYACCEVNSFCRYAWGNYIQQPCLFAMGLVVFSIIFHVICACLLVLFSYAINHDVYNMTTGCLLNETRCEKPLAIYTGTDYRILALYGMYTLFAFIIFVGVLLHAIHAVLLFLDKLREEHRMTLVESLPSTSRAFDLDGSDSGDSDSHEKDYAL